MRGGGLQVSQGICRGEQSLSGRASRLVRVMPDFYQLGRQAKKTFGNLS